MSNKKSNSIGFTILIILSICLVFGANAWKSNLLVKQIKISGNKVIGVNEIIQLTQVQTNTLLFDVDLTSIQRNIISHYYIKDAIVERNLPSTISISIVEREPVAITIRNETFYLDEDGVILPRVISRKLFDLPIISGISASVPLKYGSSIAQDDVIESLKILMLMKKANRPLYHTISEVLVRNGGDIILYTTEGNVPIIFGRGEIASKLVLLETFWNDVARVHGPQNLKYVDLRYRDQVITKWNSELQTPKG